VLKSDEYDDVVGLGDVENQGMGKLPRNARARTQDHQSRRRHPVPLGLWERLTAFIDNPIVWLDNNATERALRDTVAGRRNHFGSK
jgi:hypothetical protein